MFIFYGVAGQACARVDDQAGHHDLVKVEAMGFVDDRCFSLVVPLSKVEVAQGREKEETETSTGTR